MPPKIVTLERWPENVALATYSAEVAAEVALGEALIIKPLRCLPSPNPKLTHAAETVDLAKSMTWKLVNRKSTAG